MTTSEEEKTVRSWVDQITACPGITRLYKATCYCGAPVIEHRSKPTWDIFEQKLIHGVQGLTTLILLKKTRYLTELRISGNPKFPALRTMTIKSKLNKDAYYLPHHICGWYYPNNVANDFTFPMPEPPNNDDVFGYIPEPTKDELREFIQLWYPKGREPEDSWKLF